MSEQHMRFEDDGNISSHGANENHRIAEHASFYLTKQREQPPKVKDDSKPVNKSGNEGGKSAVPVSAEAGKKMAMEGKDEKDEACGTMHAIMPGKMGANYFLKK